MCSFMVVKSIQSGEFRPTSVAFKRTLFSMGFQMPCKAGLSEGNLSGFRLVGNLKLESLLLAGKLAENHKRKLLVPGRSSFGLGQ